MKRTSLLIASIVFSVTACGIGGSTGPGGSDWGFGLGGGGDWGGYSAPTLIPDRDQLLVVGDSLILDLVTLYGSAEVRWETASPNVRFTNAGTDSLSGNIHHRILLKTRAPGDAQIVAAAGNKSFTRLIRVIPLEDIASIFITTRSIPARPSTSFGLTATVSDKRGNAVDSAPVFSVSDTTVARVRSFLVFNQWATDISFLKTGQVILRARLGTASDSVAISVSG